MKNIISLTLVLFLTLLGGCHQMDENWNSEGDFFYLKSKGAVMPVWVVGNVESKTFLITNHGGPGCNSGLDFHKSEHFFQRLEDKYAVVYWDQRMSGNSKGDPKLEDLTLDQHVEDLEKLITLIRSKYEIESTFLYGHSWGAGLSILYLGKDDNQNGINGWIDEDGALQDKYEMDLKREWILPRAHKKLEETGDKYWKKVIQWWADNPNPDEGDWDPYEHVRELGGYIYDEEQTKKLNPYSEFERTFFSFKSFLWNANQYVDTEWMAGYDFMPSAKKINIPSLIIWGKEDGAGPVAVSDTLYKLLSTPTEHKYLHQFDKCAHSPHAEKPFEAFDLVVEFIEKYK